MLAAIAVCAIASTLAWGVQSRLIRDHSYAVPSPHCANDADCAEKALQIQAREASIAEDALAVSFMQLALSVAGVFGVGLTIYYAHKAWRESERSAAAAQAALDDARSDSALQAARFESQLAVASAAADATAAQVKITSDTAKTQLRAYVHAEKVTVAWTSAGYPVFSITLRNTGQTPAIGVICGARHFFGNTEALGRLDAIGTGFLLGGHSPIGAGSTYETSLLVENAEAIQRKKISAQSMLAVVGRIIYSDVFGDMYETEFSFFAMHPDSAPLGTISGRWAMYRSIDPAEANRRQYSKPHGEGPTRPPSPALRD